MILTKKKHAYDVQLTLFNNPNTTQKVKCSLFFFEQMQSKKKGKGGLGKYINGTKYENVLSVLGTSILNFFKTLFIRSKIKIYISNRLLLTCLSTTALSIVEFSCTIFKPHDVTIDVVAKHQMTLKYRMKQTNASLRHQVSQHVDKRWYTKMWFSQHCPKNTFLI